MSQKKHTKEELKVEEAFTKSELFLINNKKNIVAAVAVIAVVIIGIIMYKTLYSEPREEKAQAALFKGEELFGNDQFELALNGDSLGYQGFLKVADEFSGTDAANLAKAYAGICYAHLNKYEEALKYLNDFDADDQLVSPAILAAAGNCYAELKQYEKAASILMEAAEQAESNTLSPVYLMQAGQLFVQLKKYDDAINAYTIIKNDYFQSYQARDIDKYIEQAKLLKK